MFPPVADMQGQLDVLRALSRRVTGAILFVGDSQLRNQFLALARLLLNVPC